MYNSYNNRVLCSKYNIYNIYKMKCMCIELYIKK